MSKTLTINTESWRDELFDNQPYSVKNASIDYKIFNLVEEHHPILKKVMPPFDFNTVAVNPTWLASSLVETCKLYRGLGLSANQCGLEYRVFVMGYESAYVAFFNPEILEMDGEQTMEEGCLSFPHLFFKVRRAKTVKVRYQDYQGQVKETTFTGLTAVCFQHELDHMNGITYTSKVGATTLHMAEKKRTKIKNQLRKT